MPVEYSNNLKKVDPSLLTVNDEPGITSKEDTIDDLYEIIDEANIINEIELTGNQKLTSNYLIQSNSDQILRMMNNGSLLRIGDIWFGNIEGAEVTGLMYFSNKEIQTVQPLRADMALSFSRSLPPTDTMKIELMVHVNNYQSHVQRLCASTEITPTLPVMNPTVAAILQPVHTNKRVYDAYGHSSSFLTGSEVTNKDLMYAYCTTPVQCHIDDIMMSYAGPADIRIEIQLTRTMTANSYGDRVLYCRSIEDAYIQHQYLRNFEHLRKDSETLKLFGNFFHVYDSGIDTMVQELQKLPDRIVDSYSPERATITEINDGDTAELITQSGKLLNIRFYGIDTPETESAFIGMIGNDWKTKYPELKPQPYSYEAKEYLKSLIRENGREVILIQHGEGYYGRTLGEIYTLNGKNINLEMVKAGLAHANISHDSWNSHDQLYIEAEQQAINSRRNIWSQPSESIKPPSVFRTEIKAYIGRKVQ